MGAIIGHFGKDYESNGEDFTVAHLFHSIKGFDKQPIECDGAALFADCDIYNHSGLAKKYSINALDDVELMIKLINKIGLRRAINEFSGVYSACYIKDGKACVFRDKLGEKPLWFGKKPSFRERKALSLQGVRCVNELNQKRFNL